MLATIDVGTNSVLMQVTQASAGGELHVLDDFMTITRLGQGVDRTRALHEDAIARTLAALSNYAEIAHAHGAPIMAVGTSALRDAENAARFSEAAHETLGAPVEVIIGAREAELTYAGGIEGLPLGRAARASSTSAAAARRSSVARAAGRRAHQRRHRLGALVRTPCGQRSRETRQLEAIRSDVFAAIDASDVQPSAPLVAIAGTATTLAAISGEVDPYDPTRIHGARLSLVMRSTAWCSA